MDKPSAIAAGLAIVLALGAGGVMALQPAVNARLAAQCEHRLHASVVSFAIGLLALLVISMLLGVGLPRIRGLGDLPWWAWTGGLLGAYMVTVSLLVAPALGATRWIVLVLTGQIVLSLLLDHFGLIGYSQHSFNWLRLLGVVCVALGAIIVLRS